ncbi:MAG: transcriptional regulator [Pyrinomonas sp.]|uniref:winged helix-turn-helix transcriptional regulator n=1 Tax=Pyrinomonas sp. TaxID=2080306 RepID=UPI00331A284A
MKRRQSDGCPVMGALQWVGDRWTLLVVRDLARGPRRTTELLTTLHPISSRTLVGRLREMEKAALIERREFNGSPPHVEYALTDRGKLLLPLLDALRRAGEALGCCACEDRRRQRGSYCEACPQRSQQNLRREVPVVLL